MNIEELDKLEGKINDMVYRLKGLKDENKKLIAENEELKKETSLNSHERDQVKQKVATLIELIDSLELE
ncbi:MAG TPA: cell division protein ZapB [Candidatus Kapabacteria bacterium]|nr:cell division protein ZapB [Candidatus Kapabacteria bacterium]